MDLFSFIFLLTSTRSLPVDSLNMLITALLDELPDDENADEPSITVKSDSAPSSPASAEPRPKKPAYDPKVVYILELCTVLALRDPETVEQLGKGVSEALQSIIREPSRHHSSLVSRAAFYQFNILKASYVSRLRPTDSREKEIILTAQDQDHDFVRAPVLLHAISTFPKEILTKTAQLVLQGLKLCIDRPGPLRSEIMTSPDFWVVLRTLSAYPHSSPVVFEILEGGVSGTPSAIIADNYEAAISLLNDFAAAAKDGVPPEQQQQKADRRQKNARLPKKDPPRYDSSANKYTTLLYSASANLPLLCSDNAAVLRGVKAVNLISSMTARIPHLIDNSHLESKEGKHLLPTSTSPTHAP